MVPQPVYMVDSRAPVASQPDYKTCFESIKSSVSKTKLDSDWTITESKVGISSNDRELVAIVNRSAKYVGTN